MKYHNLLSILAGTSLSLSSPILDPAVHKRAVLAEPPMMQLNTDPSFHFVFLSGLSFAPYEGADIGELLVIAKRIIPGNFESFHKEFYDLAERTHQKSLAIDAEKFPVSARNSLFREANYYRKADFYIHGNWSDPRINKLWVQQAAAFDKAISLLPVPGERHVLKANGFEVPVIFYGTQMKGPRPTMLICNGYDGSQEDAFHMMGMAAVERGINVITFEGPGQPTVRRQQNIGFIHNWEEVVRPVVDYALSRREVAADAIGLTGISMGGYLAPRAAAFEPRLAAVLAIDGVLSAGESLLNKNSPDQVERFKRGDAEGFDAGYQKVLDDPASPPARKWGIQQGLWAFKTTSPFEWMTRAQKMDLTGILDRIRMPMFIADAENENSFPGQAKKLADKMGKRATYHMFRNIDGAGEHVAAGGAVLQNQVMFDWFQEVVSSKKTNQRST